MAEGGSCHLPEQSCGGRQRNVFENIKKLRTYAILYENKRETTSASTTTSCIKGWALRAYIEITKVREMLYSEKQRFLEGKARLSGA